MLFNGTSNLNKRSVPCEFLSKKQLSEVLLKLQGYMAEATNNVI